ncbi:DNA phosphorothioation-dependent restriction protein DptG [Neobacillus drentensis]|uniref:DNA phosphorothioation-dependent restriction protein DptG n=1 Tax=Neobacillus drentensis TaxID=220684 RepID=UPI001F45A03B|nr:DNA phosphorothioation-dependent restriction protein DptG [Neobacillus drentensis]ULT59607.1 DNA phosphorothioation-dependent restriction protein DptG [Neobacillus drentensis]
MRAELNRASLEDEFKVSDDVSKKVRFTHSSGSSKNSRIRFLPYSASKNTIDDFHSVIGNFSRYISQKKYESFDKEAFLNNIKNKVESTKKYQLEKIINEMFFDDNGQLVLSHPVFFNFLSKGGSNESKVANFLGSVLSTKKVQLAVKEVYEKKPDNVLLALLFDSLPKLKDQIEINEDYYCMFPEIRQCFEEDFLFLLEREDLLIIHFSQFVTFYYFFYVTQFIVKVDKMFEFNEEGILPIYFNVDWESRSSTRDSYKMGWKMISSKIPKLFAHINCLVMLNHINNEKYENLTYKRFIDLVFEMNEEEKKDLQHQILQLNRDYQSYLGDVDWSRKNNVPFISGEQEIFTSVRELQHSIAYQFQTTGRKKPSTMYYEGYEELAKNYYLKRSGSLGYTLNLTQQDIVFLTKLCIKKNQKISLNVLFKELEKRGVFFDRDSKKQVTLLYSRLNLLEKKSDSGDAQYVKYIL